MDTADAILESDFILTPRESYHWEDHFRLWSLGWDYPSFVPLNSSRAESVVPIRWHSELNAAIASVDEVGISYPTVFDAYKAHYDGATKFVQFEKDNLRNCSELDANMMFENGEYAIDYYEQDDIYVAKYVDWLRNAALWVKNSTSFYESFVFVRNHPAVWTLRNVEQNASPDDWNLGHTPIPEIHRSADGTVLIGIEGSVRNSQYTSLAHDHMLDSYTDSYENSIIKYAKILHSEYDLQGQRRKP